VETTPRRTDGAELEPSAPRGGSGEGECGRGPDRRRGGAWGGSRGGGGGGGGGEGEEGREGGGNQIM